MKIKLVLEVEEEDQDQANTGSGLTEEADNRLNEALSFAGFEISKGPDRLAD